MVEKAYISRKGLERLNAELQEQKRRRPLISKAIEEAREKGDLKENAEYHAAKEELAHNQRRTAELENKIASAEILEDQDIPTDKAYIGASVDVEDESGSKMTFTLADASESDPSKGVISVASPIGQSLLGQGEGAEVKVPVGKAGYKLKILKIYRDN